MSVLPPTLTFFDLPNDAGQDLLDDRVRPICRDRGVGLAVAGPKENRGTAMLRQAASRFVLWDCSVEGPRRVYDALNGWVKVNPKHLLVSRTPLPRNVLAFRQRAPVHGESLSNAELAEWLDRHLHAALSGGQDGGQGSADAYWMFENPADYFFSFRGNHRVRRWTW